MTMLTDSLALALARARRAAVRGETDEAIARLQELRTASGTHAFLPASLMLGELYRDRGEEAEAVHMFRLVEKGVERAEPSETALNLGLAWQSVHHPGCARKVYSSLVRDFPFEKPESVDDERQVRLAAVAAYRLGWLTIGRKLEEAWTWWQRALDTGVAEVAPHAALALATEIGPVRFYSARIEELFRQVVDFDDPHASPRAALELGRLFASRLQFSQADEFLGYAIDSEHPEYAPPATQARQDLLRPGGGPPSPAGSRLLASARLALRGWDEGRARSASAREKRLRVLIVGAGTGGQYLLESLRRSGRPYEVCGFVDDEATEVPEQLGVEVLGKLGDLPDILAHQRPHEVFMAIPTAPGSARARVVHDCGEARIPLLNLPTMHELHHDRDLFAQLRPVRIEETCGGNPVLVDRAALAGLRGQAVLLIGGAGAIGSALARRMASGQVKYLMLLDRNEASLERLTRELTVERGFSRVFAVLGDAYDEAALEQAFRLRQPSHVFFAAGSAQPRLFEDNIVSAARDEVLGAAKVARLVAEHAVSTLLFVSSTCAARPRSAFAAAKALSEFGVHAASNGSATSCTTLRVGSLFRSPGSPVEVFERQIELGGPVPVPDGQLTRKFLTGARVAELCLWAARVGGPGERLAIDAGEPLNLREMATEMIRLAGGMVDIDTWVDHVPTSAEWSGSDEIAGEDEIAAPTAHMELVSLHGRHPAPTAVAEALERLQEAVAESDPIGVRRILLEQVEWLLAPAGEPGPGPAPPRSSLQSNLVG